MAAPKGNRFWEARSSHGRNPKFEASGALWLACCEYFEWVEANPMWEMKAFAYVEKAIQEAGNALKAGGSKMTVGAAEKRLFRDPKILAILNKEFSQEEARAIRRMGIVMTISGLEAWQAD